MPFDAEVGWRDATLSFQGWTLIVAEACSGSGTFLMLGVLGAFLAALFRLRPLTALVLVLASLPLTLAVNGVRIASSALVIARFGASAGEGLAHELLGQFVVIAGAGLLALLVERASARRTEVAA
jgi:exosortase/archaeosortase family protein